MRRSGQGKRFKNKPTLSGIFCKGRARDLRRLGSETKCFKMFGGMVSTMPLSLPEKLENKTGCSRQFGLAKRRKAKTISGGQSLTKSRVDRDGGGGGGEERSTVPTTQKYTPRTAEKT